MELVTLAVISKADLQTYEEAMRRIYEAVEAGKPVTLTAQEATALARVVKYRQEQATGQYGS